jgi:hypothetical protein
MSLGFVRGGRTEIQSPDFHEDFCVSDLNPLESLRLHILCVDVVSRYLCHFVVTQSTISANNVNNDGR